MPPKVYPTARISEKTSLKMQQSTFIGDFVLVTCKSLTMKKGSQVNAHSAIAGRRAVILGKDSVVGYHCLIMTSTDTPRGAKMNDASPESERAISDGDVAIGRNAFIGSHSTIMPGVTVGDRAVIGAYSFVLEDVPPNTVGWGIPYRVAKLRNPH